MKRVLQIVGYSVLATLCVLLVMGIILPNHYRTERSILIDAPAAAIHPWVADLQRWSTWANWNRSDPTLAVEYTGPAQGAGMRQSWRGEKAGSGVVTLTASDPDLGVQFTTAMGDGTRGTGAVRYAETANTTTVTWLNEGHLPRVVGGFFRGYFEQVLGDHCDEGLRRLKQAVEAERTQAAAQPAADARAP